MICDLETMGARVASDPMSSKKQRVARRVRVYRIQRGAECFGLIVEVGSCRLLAVFAGRLSVGLEKLFGELSFGGPASRCPTLETCLDVGYVMASHTAAEWMTREGRMLLDLRPSVRAALVMPGVVDSDGGAA